MHDTSRSLKFTDFVIQVMTPSPATETPSQDYAAGVDQLATVGRLLDRPELARVYVYVCYYGPVTRPEIVETLDVPKTTVYDHVGTLEALGAVALVGDRPVAVSAAPVLIDADGITVTPTLLHAVAMQVIDKDIAHFTERHGVGKLAAAVRQAGLHYAGRITQRMVAEPLGISTGEAIQIVLALEPVLAAGKQHDPHFKNLFPDVADDIAFDADIDVTAPLSDTES
ncbi:transcriptional regulator, TrmB [Halorhabdus utahensis DSM 12940]|uniref:Transcriptional regulator, TrmB n=2 Tax=Halorhabdus utahensis TaxID=146826 RepID=C7NQT5_HALUD|nr:transcriptional regulator, TrmB [Halorhabdus utahensis DSM 12940]